jgi:ubiquinone/menaquinone biosynthesis C-methylase UbiE
MTRLYDDLAAWWPLMSAPSEYAEEAAFYGDALVAACAPPPETLLELGSGGGNNASYLKARFRCTLVDRAPGMLAVSRRLNPSANTSRATCAPCASAAPSTRCSCTTRCAT